AKKTSAKRTTARQAPARPPAGRPHARRRAAGPSAAGAPPASSRVRMRGLMVTSLIVLSLFAAQLVRMQGFDSDAVAPDALAQRTQSAASPAQRGTIYDVNDTVLAQSQERRTVTVDQTAVPEYEKDVAGTTTTVGVEGAARDLAPLLGESAEDVRSKLTGE